MASKDFENAIKGTRDYKNKGKLIINFDGKTEILDDVKNFQISYNKIYVEFRASRIKSKVEYNLNTTTTINEIKASAYDVGASGGGCYLTTACTKHKGLDDNCYELETLRKFRDEYLMNNINYKESVMEYYKFSPELVNRINGDKKTLNTIYDELIIPCIKLIEQKKNNEAFKLYKQFSLQLKEDWLN